MFSFLKKRLKAAVRSFTKSVESETPSEEEQQRAAPLSTKGDADSKEPKKEHKKQKRTKAFEDDLKAAARPIKESAQSLSTKPKHKPAEPKLLKHSEEKREPEPRASKIEEQAKPALPESRAPAKRTQRSPKSVAEEKPIEDGASSKRQGFLGKIKEAFTHTTLSPEKFDELFWDLEVGLLESNVAVEVIEKLKQDLKNALTSGRTQRRSVEELIEERLKRSIKELFNTPTIDLLQEMEGRRPYVIAMIGVNGSGKTTTMAKLAHLCQKDGKSVVMAAADTFRAAAIQQLEEHATRLQVKLIKQEYHSDPASVAYDAVAHAKAKGIDVVLIDTAGRLHSNDNLMKELEKLIRVNKPDLKIFVAEATTGNDAVEQARAFDRLVGIDAIILTKSDVDEKGGAAISISYVTGKPILYLGTGQEYEDLDPFSPERILESLDL